SVTIAGTGIAGAATVRVQPTDQTTAPTTMAEQPQAQPKPEAPAPPAPPDQPLTPDEQAAHVAMSERFASWAKLTLAQQKITPAIMRQATVLLEAAVRENPDEPRFLRLLVEARLQLGGKDDLAAARKALQRYRQVLADKRL